MNLIFLGSDAVKEAVGTKLEEMDDALDLKPKFTFFYFYVT